MSQETFLLTNSNIDDVVLQILRNSVCENDTILPFLSAAETISSQRGGYYGFEWIIHTAVAEYVIEHYTELGIDDICVNKKEANSQKVPDLSFAHAGTPTYLEFKTISGNNFSYCKSDHKKLARMNGNRFIVVCGYRNGIDKQPNWENVDVKNQIDINSSFRVIVIKLC